jgi:hypothetical protein
MAEKHRSRHFAYHAVPTNRRSISAFRYHVDPDLAKVAPATQPTAEYAMRVDEPDHRRLNTARCHPSPLAQSTLRRQTSETGAECDGSALSDL